MVTKLETFAQYSKGTSYKGTWLSTEVFLIYIPQRSRCRSLIGLNSAKILIFGLRLLGLLVQADGLDDNLGHLKQKYAWNCIKVIKLIKEIKQIKN